MEWTDDAIVLGARRHGESSVVLELMTRERGRHLGLVRGGRSRRMTPTLQPGNTVRARWWARLDEHLGMLAVETLVARAADLMQTTVGLDGVQTVAAHLRLLAERDPHPELYDAAEIVVTHLGEPRLAGELVVRFEVAMLEALGFGLDLFECALTGATEDLAWVSPKTGRAASRAAGRPYADRLLPLPAFLAGHPDFAAAGRITVPADDLAQGFRLTGHFLARNVWEPRGLAPPATREGLVAAVTRM